LQSELFSQQSAYSADVSATAGSASAASFLTPLTTPNRIIAAGMSWATTIKAQKARKIQMNSSDMKQSLIF
jgi:hypothetical protein